MSFSEYRATRNVIRRRRPKPGKRCHGIIVSISIFILYIYSAISIPYPGRILHSFVFFNPKIFYSRNHTVLE